MTRAVCVPPGLTASGRVGIRLDMTSEQDPLIPTDCSSQILDIYAHISDTEERRLRRLNYRLPVMLGVAGAVAGLLSAVLPRFVRFPNQTAAQVLLAGIIMFVFARILLRWHYQSLKRCLASTEYARAQGIGPEEVRVSRIAERE